MQDPSQVPALPAGHPFSVTPIFLHWSSTTNAGDPSEAYAAAFGGGGIFSVDRTVNELTWCVRGGSGHDGGH